MAVFHVYMDETGTHDDSEIVCAAAYVAKAKDWRDWTKEWNRERGQIKIYHATDAQNLQGEFLGWKSEEVSELCSRLLPLINNGKIAAVTVGLKLRDLDIAAQNHPEIRDRIRANRYPLCFYYVVQRVLELMNKYSATNHRIAFIHENNPLTGDIVKAFEHVKALHGSDHVVSLSFGGKRDFVPLQAADILAYETNKRLRAKGSKSRMAWKALGAERFESAGEATDFRAMLRSLISKEAGRALIPWLDGIQDHIA